MLGNAPTKILIADDVKGVRQVLHSLLRKAGYQTLDAEDGNVALAMARTEAPDAVLLDIRMPGLDGFQVLDHIHELDPDLPVVMITGYGDVDTAVRAMQRGAYHYLTKPFHNAEVLAVVERAIERRSLCRQVRSLNQRLNRIAPLADALGTSEAIARLREQVDRVAGTDLAVLIIAEDGSGKELIARAIHARSPRCHGPFVAVDCGALPAALIDGEFFGYEAGASPDGDRQRTGQIELAAGGTLYLAHVDGLPLATQGRLLDLYQTQELERVGGTDRIALDVRIIASASIDLDDLVAGQLFRRDLFVGLAEATLALPPLRERKDDIVFLVKRLLDTTNHELGKNVHGPTPEALDILLAHTWPGNLHELRHVIKRAVLLAHDQIEPSHLRIVPARDPQGLAAAADQGLPLPERTRRATEALERAAILDALRRAGGNKSRAARSLGIDYKTLYVKLRKYELRVPEESPNSVPARRPRQP